MNTGPATSSWFRENEARLEAADTAHDRGNERQAAADLLHDVVDNSEPKAATRADRASTDEGLLQSFERLRWNDSTAVEQANLPVAIDDDLDRLTGIAITHGVLDQIAQRDAEDVQFPLHDEFVWAFGGDDEPVAHILASAKFIDQDL